MSSSTQSPHVLIIGAGLAGLVLAQSLRKKGISFDIFERDANDHSRQQGWAIALHKILPDMHASLPEDLGPIEVTNHLLPLDVNAEFKSWCGDKLVAVGANSPTHPLLRANRTKLRAYLSQNLDIHWNKYFTKIEETADSVTLHFNDGTSYTGDILVGADGVHSKVRGHLFPNQDLLETLPLATIIGEVKVPKEEWNLPISLGHSAFIATAVDSDQRLMVAVNSIDPSGSHANYYWNASWVERGLARNETPSSARMSKDQLLANAKLHTSGLGKQFTQLIHKTQPEGIVSPPIIFRDLLLDSMPRSRVTLIGDSAHAMTPFKGEGGNVAMQDALNLARTIAKTRDSKGREEVMDLLAEYQDEMLARSRPVVLASRKGALDAGKAGTPNFDNWAKPSVGVQAVSA